MDVERSSLPRAVSFSRPGSELEKASRAGVVRQHGRTDVPRFDCGCVSTGCYKFCLCEVSAMMTVTWNCKLNKTFLPQLLWWDCFIIATEMRLGEWSRAIDIPVDLLPAHHLV